MFGGAGIYRDGIIFGILKSDGDLYLKGDDETAERFKAAGSRPFTHGRDGRTVTMHYWTLPSEALDDPDALKEWADLAFAAALRAAEQKKPKTKR